LASLAELDALTGALRDGILGISARMKAENTWQYQEGLWLMSQSAANWRF
jgi:hypothetical protein